MSGDTGYSVATMTTQLTSVGAAAIPYIGAGFAGLIGLAGVSLGVNKAWGLFRRGTR